METLKIFIYLVGRDKLSMGVKVYNPSPQEAEVGRSQVPSESGQHSESLSQRKKSSGKK